MKIKYFYNKDFFCVGSLHCNFKNLLVERNVTNILDECVWSTIILCGHALVIVFSLLSPEFIPMEVDKVALGKIFLQHFIFCLLFIVPPVLWFGQSGSVCHSWAAVLSVHLHKIIDSKWKAKFISGIHCLSVRGHVVLLVESSVHENCLNHQLVIEIWGFRGLKYQDYGLVGCEVI